MPVARAVVFDFNGTLSHDEPLLCRLYQEIFAEHGRPLDETEYYRSLAGETDEAIIGGWLRVHGEQLARLVAERIDRYCLIADGSTVPEAAREAVSYAAGRVPVAVVSAAYRREIEPVLEATGIAPLLTAVVSVDDVTHGKPHPEAYALALARIGGGIPPAAVVAFEDTEAGVTSAKAAGLRCLAVRGTMPDHRLSHADEIVDGIDVPLVRRLVG